jgi:hypothetical protein
MGAKFAFTIVMAGVIVRPLALPAAVDCKD